MPGEFRRILDSLSDEEVMIFFSCAGHVTTPQLERRYQLLAAKLRMKEQASGSIEELKAERNQTVLKWKAAG